MARQFDIPSYYKSRITSQVKRARQATDSRKQDLSPSVLDFGPVRFHLARHFGFCFGVENAIEIAYKTLEDNPDRRAFLLSEMIHNPSVNQDLHERGVQFLFTPSGEPLIPLTELTPDDIVIVPAFGTTMEIQAELSERGIDPYTYNTTCPFVEKVWNRSSELGQAGYTVVVHGKATHEETRATFSHSVKGAHTVVVLDLDEARLLGDTIRGTVSRSVFETTFGKKCSEGFDPNLHLSRVGVVNQTTMLATETREIARELRDALAERYGEGSLGDHYADTSDTLCYATNENQNATYALVEQGAALALVVGGYNSSNTSHIVELCARSMPTYFIRGGAEILSEARIRHFDLSTRTVIESTDWFPSACPLDIVLTCGASCPDALMDEVLVRVLALCDGTRGVEEVLAPFSSA